jgi:hypothetical protein
MHLNKRIMTWPTPARAAVGTRKTCIALRSDEIWEKKASAHSRAHFNLVELQHSTYTPEVCTILTEKEKKNHVMELLMG